MKAKVLFSCIVAVIITISATAQENSSQTAESADSTAITQKTKAGKALSKFASRLTIGGYGEAVMTYNMYSDNFNRYSKPADYANAKGHGRFDLPHVTIMIGYDFGKGWSMGTEVEFEHGGVEAAVEVEGEEAGEFEQEIERGGEVALEQFWIQKSFFPQLNVRAGHIIVPVGLTNTYHLPTEFFTVYRPEGENTIIPCTWHETGISVWGKAGKWRYEALMVAGLNARMFENTGWVHDGSASAYEGKVANTLAGAFRVDNWSVKGLRMGLSGYVGNSFKNDIRTEASYTGSGRYSNVKGIVMIGAFDFMYDDHNLIIRGNFDYGYLTDAAVIGTHNKSQDHSTQSPYPHTLVGKAAMAGGAEIGYDFFSLNDRLKGSKLYLFGRYEYYDSYIPAAGVQDYEWSDKHRIAVGINYYPIKEVVIKAEYSHRFLKSQYNNEPSLSIGIAYSGFFKH